MTIGDYLRELRRVLPGDPLFRRRVLDEVEEHLRESAAAVGEDEAVRRMGAPNVVAAGFAGPATTRASRSAAAILGGCLLGFVGAYLTAENALPPAPWPSADAAPDLLRWTSMLTNWAFAAAVAAGVSALALAALARSGAATVAGSAAALGLAVACASAFVGGLRRATLYDELEVAGRLTPAELLAGELYVLALASVALAAAGWATRVWFTASRASRS